MTENYDRCGSGRRWPNEIGAAIVNVALEEPDLSPREFDDDLYAIGGQVSRDKSLTMTSCVLQTLDILDDGLASRGLG